MILFNDMIISMLEQRKIFPVGISSTKRKKIYIINRDGGVKAPYNWGHAPSRT